MRLDHSQQLRLSQEMKLAPRIIQAMEILQLPMLALRERIDVELVSNPVLELQESNGAEASAPAEDFDGDRGEKDLVIDEGGTSDDFARLDEMTAEYGADFANAGAPAPARKVDSREPDRKFEAMANAPAPAESLNDHLRNQWMFVDADAPVVEAAGDLIIDYIDEDGYLRTPLGELLRKAPQSDPPITLQSLREALGLVQTLEPLGVGARDLKECLLLQLDAKAAAGKDVSLERQLVADFLREIEMNRLPAIAKRTGKSIEQIEAGIKSILRLDARPGLLIGSQPVPVINPDVIVEIDDNDQIVVTMLDGGLPALAINDYYAEKASNRKTDRNARQFLKKNIRSAQWLIESIAQRRHTIRRVTEEVFKVQREFLDAGAEAMKPLPMADVAGKVGVHVATVSRAVAGKYAQTQRGIFPLRMFFSGGTKTADGEDMSWDAVKARLQEIVDGEDKSNPLNDDQLTKALRDSGIDIARRTVAKYRGVMNIPPARKRRKY